MKPRLLELIRCPACGDRLSVVGFDGSDQDVIDGMLTCACGATYPIVGTIPRLFRDAWVQFPEFRTRYSELVGHGAPAAPPVQDRAHDRRQARTQESFGYQWTTFAEMACDFRENFFNYLHPATAEFFEGKVGLDAGCGFGRHLYQAARCGAEMVGVDFSRAIESSYKNTRDLPNVHLLQGDIYALPFASGTFDFAYSVGVLHHLPDPPRATQAVANVVRDGGTFFVWVYSKKRRLLNRLLEMARSVTTRLPHRLVDWLSFVGAVIDRFGFVLPYQVGRRLPGVGASIERLTPARVKLYAQYPFQVMHADWFDRLAAPIRYYYDEEGVRELLNGTGVTKVQVSPTGLYGWRGCGTQRLSSGG